ncbi:MAG: MAPEG family protein [Burkholderiales bacterium]|nr:MAPEG family protein [Burkholderiales bacterium]
MTIANWCVLAACALPPLTVGLAKASTARRSRKNGGYDNNNPRSWANQLTGWQQRANAAQANGFEALPLFIAAVVLAQQAHADQGRIDTLALAFIAIRVAYVAIYLMNWGAVRSLVWTAGFGVCVAILAMA